MTSAWRAIAKAEFLVSTSRFRRFRLLVLPLIYMIAIGWALLIAPMVMDYVLGFFISDFETLLAIAFPGLLRSAMLFLFMLVMIGPISNSLEEIKIGQWEIIISNNVRTRDILLGTYLAKIPVFGLLVFILAPVIVSTFAIVYEVSVLGQFLMYLVILSFTLITLWISNIVGTMIQAKLGDSPRGNDIAKGFSWLVVIFIAIPGMALLYFMESFATTMNLNLALLLPSTWSADLLTWLALYLNDAYIPASTLLNFESILFLSPVITIGLYALFSFGVLHLGLQVSDKLFTISAGARTERIVTIKKENIIYRFLRKALPKNFGIIVLTSLKDFTRKMQNSSKLIYALFLTSLMPVIISSGFFGDRIDDPLFMPIITILTTSLMLGIFSGITFGGVGFIDSRDQLWILKSVPRGDFRFIAGRVFSYLLLTIPLAFIPSTVSFIILTQDLQTYLVTFLIILIVVCSAVFVGIGVTALNPSYTDTKSQAFTINTVATILIMMGTWIASIIVCFKMLLLESVLLGFVISGIPLLIVALSVLLLGSLRMHLKEG